MELRVSSTQLPHDDAVQFLHAFRRYTSFTLPSILRVFIFPFFQFFFWRIPFARSHTIYCCCSMTNFRLPGFTQFSSITYKQTKRKENDKEQKQKKQKYNNTHKKCKKITKGNGMNLLFLFFQFEFKAEQRDTQIDD